MVKFNPDTGRIELDPIAAAGIGIVIFLLGAFNATNVPGTPTARSLAQCEQKKHEISIELEQCKEERDKRLNQRGQFR